VNNRELFSSSSTCNNNNVSVSIAGQTYYLHPDYFKGLTPQRPYLHHLRHHHQQQQQQLHTLSATKAYYSHPQYYPPPTHHHSPHLHYCSRLPVTHYYNDVGYISYSIGRECDGYQYETEAQTEAQAQQPYSVDVDVNAHDHTNDNYTTHMIPDNNNTDYGDDDGGWPDDDHDEDNNKNSTNNDNNHYHNHNHDQQKIRVGKVLQKTHGTTKRETNRLIEKGMVSVNGILVTRKAYRVIPYVDEIKLNGTTIEGWEVIASISDTTTKTTDDDKQQHNVWQERCVHIR